MKKMIMACAAAMLLSLGAEIFADDVVTNDAIITTWGSAVLSKDGGVAKIVVNDDKGMAAAVAKEFQVSGQSEWKLEFSAKGNVSIEVMLNNKVKGQDKGERFNVVSCTILQPDEWLKIEKTFKIPEGVDKATLAIFCWKQKGYFQIQDLKLSAVAKK